MLVSSQTKITNSPLAKKESLSISSNEGLPTANKEMLPTETKWMKVEDGDVDNINTHSVFGKA